MPAGTYKVNQLSVTANPGSIDDGNAEEVALTVPGAKAGDVPVVVKETDDNTYVVASWVSADDTVTAVVFNPSGGTVDPASQTFLVTLL